MTSRRFQPGALLVLLVGLVSSSWSSDLNGKISSRVLSETANGASTEALVVLTQQADLSPAYTLNTKLEKGYFVVNALRAVAGRTQGSILNLLQQRGIPYQSFFIVNMIKVTGDRNLMQELAARADVARVDANPYVKAAAPVETGSDSFQPDGIEWNVTRVKAPDVWALGYKGEGRVVAGNDTGVQWDHPALKNHYRGWDGQQVNHDYNWHDGTSQHSKTPIDPHGHGTFTVSEMVGDDGGNNQIGVAPGAKWIACRNMDSSGTGSPATYTECFEFLIAPYPVNGGQGDPSKAPDSINNSWGCPPSEGCSYDTLKSITEAVRAAGIFPAVAAGNSGPSCSSITDPPALYDAAVTIGATTSSNDIASFSSRGPITVDGSKRTKPDLSAPGQGIRGAVPGNGYSSGWSGTSMATPHIAGGVALLWQVNPALVGNVDKTEANMEHSATHLTTSVAVGNCRGPGVFQDNTFGWGLLNLLKAVQQ